MLAATLCHLSAHVSAMIQLQLLTGARPGEICSMRGCDIDTGGKLWIYRPHSHKAQHWGHERVIYLGPKARAIVEQYLKPNPQLHLFSPADAERARRQERSRRRKTPLSCGNRPGSNRKRNAKEAGNSYTVASYRRAISRACDAAFAMPAELREPQQKAGREAEAALPAAERERRQRERQDARHRWRREH
jgi:integrase